MVLAVNWGNALIITLLGFSLVFVLLVVLVFIVLIFGRVMSENVKDKKVEKSVKVQNQTEMLSLTDEENTAVALAMHLAYEEIHDEETRKLTIKQTQRECSPWNSKIFGINNLVK